MKAVSLVLLAVLLAPFVHGQSSAAIAIDRTQYFTQTSASAPAPQPMPFALNLNIRGTAQDMSAWAPAFYKPGSGGVPQTGSSSATNTGTLNFSSTPNNGDDYMFSHDFATNADLLATYPLGAYGVKFANAPAGPTPSTFTAGLEFATSGSTYASVAPQVVSVDNGAFWSSGLKLQPTGLTTLTLNTFPQYTTSTYGSVITAGIYDPSGNVVGEASVEAYYLPTLGVNQPAVTELSIDGSWLTAGVNYTLEIQYVVIASAPAEGFLNGENFQGVASYVKNTTMSVSLDSPLPGIVSSPQSVTVAAGATATFSVSAAGEGPLTYAWQMSAPGATTWSWVSNGGPYSGASTPTLSVVASAGLNGYYYRCIVFNNAGYTPSGSAILTVSGGSSTPTITSSPQSKTVAPGATATFSASASGPGPLTYAWQLSAPGATTWSWVSNGGAYSGASTPTLSVVASAGLNGYYYRCIVFNNNGYTPTGSAILTVSGGTSPTITSSPQSTSVANGATATFSVGASGSGPLTYAWQYSAPGSTSWSWVPNGGGYSGAATATLSVTASSSVNGYYYRCIVYNPNGYTPSGSAVLTVSGGSPPTITASPQSTTVSAGATATFTAAASGTGPLTYAWQLSAPGATTWSWVANGGAYSGASTPTLSVVASAGLNGYYYRCIVFNNAGYTPTGSAILTVN